MADLLESLTRVVREQRGALVRLARREGLSAEDALDAVHDAFCTLLTKPEDADLLAGIVVNTARNLRRRHRLARPHDAISVEHMDAGVSPETLVAYSEECVRLRGCINRLCKTQRTVVLMRLLEERDGEDVADVLGVSRGYVDVLLHRARASLTTCMLDRA